MIFMAWLNGVKKGQAITAAWANSLIEAVTDLQKKPAQVGALFTSSAATIQNNSGGNKAQSGILAITGMRGGTNITPTEAFNRFKESGFQLIGGTPTSTSVVASLTEAIPDGKIGNCACEGLVAAFVTFGPGSTNYTRANSANNFVAAQAGQWVILGRSSIASNRAFCYLYRQPPVGHRVVTLTSPINGTGTTTVTIDGASVAVTCPLLRENESIAAGSVVIVSFNGGANVWQVIEAQCPDNSGSGS